MGELTEKHAQFCREYLIDLNAAAAALRSGYSPDRAAVTGCELMKREDVSREIQRLMDKRKERTMITADRVLQELARIAFGDPRAVVKVDENGNVIITPSDQLSADDAACISEIHQTDKGTKIKMHSKLDALDKLGKHLKLFSDNVNINHNVVQMPSVVINQADGSVETIDFDIGSDTIIDHEPTGSQ